MSRSSYSDEGSQWDLIRWRGAVASAIRGRRGQTFLRELAEALDSMSAKELIAENFECEGGVCALGRVGQVRGTSLADPDSAATDARSVACNRLGITDALAAEIMWINDEAVYYGRKETPEQRWKRVREWVDINLKADE